MLDAWIHIASTMDCDGVNSTNRMYIDGDEKASSTDVGGYVEEMRDTGYPGGLGSNLIQNYNVPVPVLDSGFLGFFASFKYFEGLRTQTEIQAEIQTSGCAGGCSTCPSSLGLCYSNCAFDYTPDDCSVPCDGSCFGVYSTTTTTTYSTTSAATYTTTNTVNPTINSTVTTSTTTGPTGTTMTTTTTINPYFIGCMRAGD